MADKPTKELGGPRKLSTTAKVIIVLFAAIMAFSMMLPSLASVFSRNGSSSSDDVQDEQVSEEESQDAEEEEDTFDPLEGVPENETLQSLATTNAQKAHDLEKRLEKDPENLAALLNLGQTYMNWGNSAMSSSQSDEEKAYSKGLLDKATDAFNRYLEIRDSDAVRVDLAQCQYYSGDTEGAIAALDKLTKEKPDSPLAWVYLGMFYEQKYDYENATAAYKKAIETDPDDEYGIKSYANQQLISMNSTVDSPADAGDATIGADTTDDGQDESLSDTLGGL